MAESTWTDLYDEAKTGVVAAIPEGPYDVVVAAVRPLPKSRLLFLDLEVLAGPYQGKTAQVNLYLPEAGNRGAGFHFRNKILGFGDLSETFRQMDSAAGVEGALDILADALTGKRVSADLELRADGEYAGTNQLAKTKPIDGTAAVPAAAVNTPQESREVAQRTEAPAPLDEDEVTELRRKLAEAEAANGTSREAVAAVSTGEVPF